MEYQSGAVRPIESVSQGWNIIKDNYWIFFGMSLVMIIIVLVVAIVLSIIESGITYGITLALGMATQGAGDVGVATAAIAPQLISMVISVFTNLIVVTISGVLACGIYKALSRTARGEVADFGDLFSQTDKVVPCLIIALIMVLIQFVIGLVTLIGGAAIGLSALGAGLITSDGQLNPKLFGGLFLVFIFVLIFYLIFSLIISALTSFVYPLIADRGLSGGQALMLSIKSGFSNLGGLILLLILLGIMAFGGALLCLVGVLFVAPILNASLFAAFQSVFGQANDFRQSNPPPPPTFGNQPGY